MTSLNTNAQVVASQCIAYRLRILHRVVTGIYQDSLRSEGIDMRVSQMNILTLILQAGPITPSNLCMKMRLDASTASRNIDRLIAKNWVRTKAGQDERSHQLFVTTNGKRTLKKALIAWQKAQDQTESILGKDGIATIRRLANRVLAKEK